MFDDIISGYKPRIYKMLSRARDKGIVPEEASFVKVYGEIENDAGIPIYEYVKKVASEYYQPKYQEGAINDLLSAWGEGDGNRHEMETVEKIKREFESGKKP
jgi:hypothetical protein